MKVFVLIAIVGVQPGISKKEYGGSTPLGISTTMQVSNTLN